MCCVKSYSPPYNQRLKLEFGMVLLVGCVTAASLVFASSVEVKWFFFIVVSILSVSIVLLVPHREKFLLYLAVLVLPLGLDFHLVFLKSSLIRPINGIFLTAFDIPFFFLCCRWLVGLAASRARPVRMVPKITIPFFLIFGIACIGIQQSTAPMTISAWSLWVLFENWLVFLYLSNNIKDSKTIRTVINMFVLILLVESVIGLVQWLTGGLLGASVFGEKESSFLDMRAGFAMVSRVGGTLGHPNRMAIFLGLLLPLNLTCLLAPKTGRRKILLSISLIAAMCALFLTASRAVWLALSFGFSVAIYWCLLKKSGKKLASALFTVAIVSILIVSSLSFVGIVKQRLFEHDYGAARTRIPLAVVALNVIRHHPWIGVGMGDYAHKAIFYDNSREGIYAQFPVPIHNEFLLIAAELGLIAFGLFMWIVVDCFINLYQTSRVSDDPLLSYAAIGMFCGLLTALLALQVGWEYIILSTRYWFIFGLAQAMRNLSNVSKTDSSLR